MLQQAQQVEIHRLETLLVNNLQELERVERDRDYWRHRAHDADKRVESRIYYCYDAAFWNGGRPRDKENWQRLRNVRLRYGDE